jgi:hypothetical protein
MRNALDLSARNWEGKRTVWSCVLRQDDNIKMEMKETALKSVVAIYMNQNSVQLWILSNVVLSFRVT